MGSWLCYDFANSVFQQCAIAFWLPVFLNLIARDHACAYTFEPLANYDKTVTPKFFRGYQNTSTICTYDWSQNGTIEYTEEDSDFPPLWMERINPNNGIGMVPVYIRQQEPARNPAEQKEVSKD